MIYSMTAFARKQIKGDWGTAVWEIRSVNQRYLETYFRLPEQFRGLEAKLKESFKQRLQRGKIECGLRFEGADNSQKGLEMNQELASQIIKNAQWVAEQAGNATVNPIDILKWPGVMQAPEQDVDAITIELMAGFEATLDEFIEARSTEGANLAVMIEQRLAGISEQASIVRGFMPDVQAWQKARILKKFEDAKVDLDSTRVEQELVLLAQKSDVAEELDRLDSHVSEAQNVLKKGGAVGRRLDFMMQEFNREANTLGSKVINTDITAVAVECKVLIEQMREQVQNIE
ncbi:YicC/YloC family endoribonuclease [Psychromonas sp. Urea-02u-13]|uniref:YicC/YloC family endoribonuclease n=1 Tax=Psychromonas sp. Urea-02u-13 TaxID=2058326 RepID=UPI000C320870|nr:YicC/YloC family endoribonuclease [Psychromonas sp. Urea-02u-13]PKG39146.1 YicC family protein [Psychromonas sp. Urea-02u-13]